MASTLAHEFKVIVGKSRPVPNAAFLGSLTGDACYKAAAENWLAVVLPECVTMVGGVAHLPIRICTFVFMPAFILEVALDEGGVVMFPLPLQLGEFLRGLLAKGMPTTPVESAVAAQERVLEYASQLPSADRMLDATGERRACHRCNRHQFG